MVYEGSFEHDTIYNPLGNCRYLDEINVREDDDAVELKQGWAERREDGDAVGTNFEPRYRALVDKWYDIGTEKKEHRMTAGMMLRTIRAMFPRNYDFPSERHLKNRISARSQAASRREKREQHERMKV